MNYFSPENAAERYAKGRPYFHLNTMKRVKDFLKINSKVATALDVACGTGLSSKALLEIAEKVYGLDSSVEMLKWAPISENIDFRIGSAENIPFSDCSFDLMTVASGVHWFDIDVFLKEAQRLLKPTAWLVLYDNFFLSKMDDVAAFDHWFNQVYLAKFPSPKRNDTYAWHEESLNVHQFNLAEEDRFTNAVAFTKYDLILYFTTQSNITAAVESGGYDYPEIEQWLDAELSRFFETDLSVRTVQYGNWIKYIQKMDVITTSLQPE